MSREINLEIAQSIKKWSLGILQEERRGALKEWTPAFAAEISRMFDSDAGIERILHDEYFLNLKEAKGVEDEKRGNVIYPAHKEDILNLFREMRERPVNLVILIEGIGSGKSTVAAVLTYLQWLKITAMYNPQAYYGMMDNEIIAFISMNRTEAQAKRVTLQKVFPKFQTVFNKEYFPPSKRKGQEIWIPRNNTLVFAGTSSAASALGYNIVGGTIDEANFLEVVEGGKRGQSVTDVYDAAEETHNAMFNRMTSRFINPDTGYLDGMLAMISSSRYPNDFLEKKVKEHIRLGKKSHIFVRRRKLWEAKPPSYFSGVMIPFNKKTNKIDLTEDELDSKKLEAEDVRKERLAKRVVA